MPVLGFDTLFSLRLSKHKLHGTDFSLVDWMIEHRAKLHHVCREGVREGK